MVEDLTVGHLALLRVEPVVYLNLGGLHYARQVLKVVVARLLRLQLLALVFIKEHA